MEAKPLRIVPSSHNNTSGFSSHNMLLSSFLPFFTFLLYFFSHLFYAFFFGGEGSGPQKKSDDVLVDDDEEKMVVLLNLKEENSSSCVELDLGAGAHNAPQQEEAINPLVKARYHKCCLFTEAQRRELDHQVLIFNHLVPHIAFAASASASASASATLDPAFHKQFPTHMSEYSPQGFEYGSMMDPEPHRCRRTDGKKWRCSRKVVPDQKYCERHVHRGCNRSRKLVETSQVNSPLTTKPSGKFQTKLTSSNTESEVSNPNPLSTQPCDTSSCTPSRSPRVVNASSTNIRLKNVTSSADYHTSFSPATAIAPEETTFTNMASVASDNRGSLNLCKKDNQTKSCIGNDVSVKSGGKGSIICDGNSISTGIGFSPRSVLQVYGCNNSYLNNRNSLELEPGRCRRTDGKKWRCKIAVVPGQKYCATHMHRGAKRRFAENEPATTDSAVTIARLPYSTATTNIQKAYCSIPSTNLSMSIPASAPMIKCSEKSPSSSDTDTTITDTMNEYSYASF